MNEIENLAHILCKEDIDENRPCIFVKGLLTPNECKKILKSIETEHVAPSKSIKEFYPGTRSTFSRNMKEIALLVSKRLKDWIPKTLDGGTFDGLREEFMFVRYYQNQSLLAHTDVRQSLVGDNEHTQSRISLTIYLDDDYEGGELAFVDGADPSADSMLYYAGGLKAVFDSYPDPKLVLRPKPGDAVIFYQNFPTYAHCVYPLKSGIKSIMRTDFMYTFNSSS